MSGAELCKRCEARHAIARGAKGVSFNLIDKGHVDEMWPVLKPFVDQACETRPGGMNAEIVHAALNLLDWQLFMIFEEFRCVGIAIVTVAINNAGERSLEWIVTGGENGDIPESVEERILVEARKFGCKRQRSVVVADQAKRLESSGFKAIGIVMEKEIT